MFNKFNQKCGRCGGPVEEQMFHQVKLQKCLSCGNVMMEGDDLNNLVQNDPSDAPNVKQATPKSIIPKAPEGAKPPTKSKATRAASGLMSIASSTILPPDAGGEPVAPPKRKNRTLLSKPKPKTPPPPPPRANQIQPSNEPTLGFGLVDTGTQRNEPELGLPGLGKEPSKDVPKSSPTLIAEEDTEEIERNFFTEDTTEFLTEEADAWTEEDEREFQSFTTGQKRRGTGLWVAGLGILAVIVLVPTGLLALQYQQGVNGPTNTVPTPEPSTPVTPAPTPAPIESTAAPSEQSTATTESNTPVADAEQSNSERSAKPPENELPAEPEPKPKPKPKPVVTKPKPKPANTSPSSSRLIAEGWKLVESSPSKAAKSFRQALDLKPGDYEANYGYGYAMLKQGDPVEAKYYLCQASGSSNRETQREVLAVMSRNGMSCD